MLWVVAVLLGGLAFLPVCDLHFDCGCRWPLLGGHSHCDVLTSGPPDCPWCHHGWTGYAAMVFAAALAFGVLWVLPARVPWAIVLLAGVGGVVAGELIAGIATSLWLGLPVLAGW